MFYQQRLSCVFILATAFLLLTIPTAYGATLLPDDEVQALRDIAETIGKRGWNFSADPCSGKWGWVTTSPVKEFDDTVTCNCSFSNGTVCHVVSIRLKSQNLQGRLPPEIIRLPYLQEIDLTRNYLNGSIPEEWGSTQLVNISLIGNRISGPIPKALANISTLTSLTLEYNQLSGVLPPELGNLPNIERILLSSNYFTGELPESLAQLTTLTDFRISDNQFTGQIPNFIQNWTDITKLVIQASGLDGPIPAALSALTKLTDLRISDLNGPNTTFPPLSNSKKLKTLILKSCNIIGKLPEYLGKITDLKVLDLSFNKLSGEIPSTFNALPDVNYIYLTGNMLTGQIPDWMVEKGENIDLSYNNFTGSSITSSCQHKSVNLFSSSSKGENSSRIFSCRRSLRCPRTTYSLHINCGGKQVTINGNTTYDEDTDASGPSRFTRTGSNWALSNTGHFLDDSKETDTYIKSNSSRLLINDTRLYTQARVSPISLTYYGFCMGNGNYTTSLHFAEIIFKDDRTYSSLGRRIFDVYIQGKRVLKDFNIEEEAGGVGRAVIKSFTALITNNTLEIHLYWAGKGTNGIPTRGVYGPLISAISVTPNFMPPVDPQPQHNTIAVGTVVGIVAAAAFAVGMLMGILWWKGCLRQRSSLDKELRSLGTFSYRKIKSATNSFDNANKIGEGGFGAVYKGRLPDGTAIAVKMLSAKSKQGNREFVNEIGMISAQQHPNLVKLYGCCTEGDQLLLIYEYLENNNLARALFGKVEHQLKLDWPTRQKICVGIARGIAYLHEESMVKIIHRDIKATNVLLDKDLNPKISDFGLAKLNEDLQVQGDENVHVTARVAGTYGYMAPEYVKMGQVSEKLDVYSFGAVALEIVCGRGVIISQQGRNSSTLLDWAHLLRDQGNLIELVDLRLGTNYDEDEAMVMIDVALLCTEQSPNDRPSMSSAVSMLEGQIPVPRSIPNFSTGKSKLEQMNRCYELINGEDDSMNYKLQSFQSISSDMPWIASSTSAGDLYPVIADSDFLNARN